jgi:hypothetical protein
MLDHQNNGLVTVDTPPQLPRYTVEEFLTPTPYQYLCDHYGGSKTALQFATMAMAANSKEVGFGITNFKSALRVFMREHQSANRRKEVINVTAFKEQPLKLECGNWMCKDDGIYRINSDGDLEYACAHPIMPVRRLRNIDTGEERMELAYARAGKWRSITVDKTTISTARAITSLSALGISVTSSTASTLVDYLNDLDNRNYDTIPESKSISRLGYISEEGFSPYVENLVFDGDASFRNLYASVRQCGSFGTWIETAQECRQGSVTARILLAASFAAPLLSIVGSLPFFVHLWGVDSGTGKTVGLMLAASVWGDPALGSYVQTFNSTQVGQERTAAFLNHLPYCIDELQLTKDSRGKSNYDVYQLAQGVGRARGRKNGGIDAAPTWSCCFFTTGESPIVSDSAGAGALNRVIDIECTAGSAVIKDGPKIANSLKQNYGCAGEVFVAKLYESEEVQAVVREIYSDYYKQLCQGDSTEKQAMAAAAILTADYLATHWIFADDGLALTVDDIRRFLATREDVSLGSRAYDYMCDWVATNINHFNSDLSPAMGETYGTLDNNIAYIIPTVFRNVLKEEGYSSRAVLSYLRSKRLIDVGAANEFTKVVRFGIARRYICLRLKTDDTESKSKDPQLSCI